jgi:hypothetical protein
LLRVVHRQVADQAAFLLNIWVQALKRAGSRSISVCCPPSHGGLADWHSGVAVVSPLGGAGSGVLGETVHGVLAVSGVLAIPPGAQLREVAWALIQPVTFDVVAVAVGLDVLGGGSPCSAASRTVGDLAE